MRTTDNSSTPPSYTPPKHSLGESLPKPKPRTIDELLAGQHARQLAGFPEDKRVYEALREARALLERTERKLTAYIGVCSGDKELTETLVPRTRELLAKWKGAS